MSKISLLKRLAAQKLSDAASGCRAQLRSPAFYYGTSALIVLTFVVVLFGPVALFDLAIQTGSAGAVVIAKVLTIIGVVFLPAWSFAIAWFERLGKEVTDSVQTEVLLFPSAFEVASSKSGDDQFISRDIAPPAEPPRHQARVNLNEILAPHFSINSGRSFGAA